MAEYVDVMNQKRRMCNSYALCSMGCPLNNTDFCGKNSGEKISADFPEVERRTMAWAAEHPEPVYPTWWKYLCMMGVIPDELGDKTLGEMTVYSLMNTYIQSDIAQKLEIEPLPKA